MKDKVSDEARSAVAAVAGGAIVHAATSGTAESMLAPFAASALLLLMHMASERGRIMAERWWGRVLAGGPKSPEDFAQEVAGRANDPATSDVIVQALRDLQRVIDEASIPPLAALTTEYLQGNRKPDRFFRAVSRALCDCEGAELADMQCVVAMAAEVATTHAAVAVVSIENGPQGATELLCARPEPPVPGEQPWQFSTPRSAAVTHLLGSNGVGENQSVFGGSAVVFDAERIARLARILGPPSTPPPPRP